MQTLCKAANVVDYPASSYRAFCHKFLFNICTPPPRAISVSQFPHIDIVPFDNAFVVKRVSGSALRSALENSVSDAHTDGRFLQVSGLRFVASWQRHEGTRVLEAWSLPNGSRQARQKIEDNKTYSIAMVSFIASGFDGYTHFRDEEALIEQEGAMTDTNLMLEIFQHNFPAENMRAADDKTTRGIERARQAILVGQGSVDTLPVVAPVVDGRIRFVKEAAL